MDSFDKFVGSRFRRMTETTGHPEPNALTAFTEQLLGERERRSVIDHLAFCADCREVVVLAMPDPEIQSLSTSVGKAGTVGAGWLHWPSVRWAALAAALLVVTTVGIQYGRHSLHRDRISPLAETIAPAQGTLPQESPVQPSTAMKAQSSLPQSVRGQSSDVVASAPTHQQLRRHFPLRETPKPTTVVGDSSLVAMNHAQPKPGSEDNSDIVKAKAPVSSVGSGVGSGPQVSSPALPLQTSPSMMLRASPRWTVTAAGKLQRSFDGGNTWETIEPKVLEIGASDPRASNANLNSGSAGSSQSSSATFRTVSAVGPEVWAGGSAGALYHSADGGIHWARVSPSDGEAVLTSDITTIKFPDPQHGTISTVNADLWSTSDAGQTWKKQQ
jgi:hypothetical protein